MACGCNGHYGYNTNGTWHPYEYPAHYGCSGHSAAAQNHNGHDKYPVTKDCANHRHTDGCWGHAHLTDGLARDRAITPTDFGDLMNPGDLITADKFNDLVNAISHERYRWHKEEGSIDALLVTPGDIHENERVLALKAAMQPAALNWKTEDQASAWSPGTDLDDAELEDGDLSLASQINILRDRVKEIQQQCTCNCNYCTCNCNYCTCNCNYSCTCNCNYSYSDERLKTNILFF